MQKVIDTLKSPQFWQVLTLLFGFVGLTGGAVEWITANQLLLVDLFAVLSLIIASIRTQKVVTEARFAINDYSQRMELALFKQKMNAAQVESIMQAIE